MTPTYCLAPDHCLKEKGKPCPACPIAKEKPLGGSERRPCSVSLTQREVIENKLLTALEDESCTAILTSKEDLEILIAALESWNWGNSSTHRSMDLAAGITQLRDEAFPSHNVQRVGPPTQNSNEAKK